jgi:raffinose/stachyose/melibiose transport system substrate-binding protein
MTRRRLLGTSAAAVGAMTASSGGPLAASASGGARHLSLAAQEGQQFEGQLILSLSGTRPEEAQQAIADAYQEQQPGVEILWELPELSADEYPAWLGTQLAAGDIRPDIVSGNYSAAYRGYVNFDRYRTSINPYTGNRWDEDLNWDFYRGVNAAGERFMLATRSVHINWFYNIDLFEQAGVQPPTSWSEFVEVCAGLQEAGITPIVGNYIWQIPQWFAQVYFDQYHTDWIETVRAQPGDWNYDPDLDAAFEYNPEDPFIHNTYTYNQQRFFQAIRDGELRYDTPEVAEIVGNLAQIFPQFATGDFFVIADPYPTFLQQQAAIMPNGTWALNLLRDDLEALSPERLEELEIDPDSVSTFEWATFENPPMEGDLVTSPVRSVESATGEYVSIVEKTQEQTDLAIDFLQFWLSPVGHEPYLEAAYASASPFSPSGPLEIRGVDDPPEVQELFDQVTLMGNAEINYNGFWTSSPDTGIHQDLRGLLQSALEETITPEEYAAQLQQYMQDNFDQLIEIAGLTEAEVDDPARQPGT